MEWNASTGLALGLVSTLTPWFFSVHSKLAAIAEQTAQGAQKIDAIAAATGRAFEKVYDVEKQISSQNIRLQQVSERLDKLEGSLVD
jgi:TolA-binding protein